MRVFIGTIVGLTSLRRLVEFLNEHLDTVEALAVELPQYVSPDTTLRAVVPRLVGRAERARAVNRTASMEKRQWDEERFMADVEARNGPDGLPLAREVL